MAAGTIPARFFAQGRARPDAPGYYVRRGEDVIDTWPILAARKLR